jgi:hypothetical protein
MLDDANRWQAPIIELAEGRYADAAVMFGEIGSATLADEADLLAVRQALTEG